MGVPHGQTGELRWLLVTAVPEAPDQDGRPQRAYAIVKDLTEQRRTEATLREGIELMGRLSAANVLGMVVADEERIYEANDTYLEIIGYTRDYLDAGGIAWREITPPEWADGQDDAVAQLRQFAVCRPFEKEYVHRDGHRVPVLVGAAVTRRDPLRWASYVVDLTAPQRAEQERAELLAREAGSGTRRGAEEQANGFRSCWEWVTGLPPVTVMSFSSAPPSWSCAASPIFCVVFLPDADGELCATSIAHRYPLREMHRGGPPRLPGSRGLPAPDHSGSLGDRRQPAFPRRRRADRPPYRPSAGPARDPGPAEPRALAGHTDYRRGPSARRARPLPQRGPVWLRRNGYRGGRDAGAPDGGRSGQRRDVRTRSPPWPKPCSAVVLPATLPEIAGLELAVRYLPATDGINVGGDWYDAFPLSGNRMGLAIGDVVGHNITSASIMGQVRTMLRAYAVDTADPSDVLHRANTALTQLLPDAMATAIYAVLDPVTGDLSYANAGHPPPVCISVSGSVDYLDAATGTRLGAPGDGVSPPDSGGCPPVPDSCSTPTGSSNPATETYPTVSPHSPAPCARPVAAPRTKLTTVQTVLPLAHHARTTSACWPAWPPTDPREDNSTGR